MLKICPYWEPLSSQRGVTFPSEDLKPLLSQAWLLIFRWVNNDEFVSLSFSMGRLLRATTPWSPSLFIMLVLPVKRSMKDYFFSIFCTGLNFLISFNFMCSGYSGIIYQGPERKLLLRVDSISDWVGTGSLIFLLPLGDVNSTKLMLDLASAMMDCTLDFCFPLF